MDLLRTAQVPVPRGAVANTAAQAQTVAASLGTKDLVIKAQVLAGGRGKGHFTSGLKGGVHLVHNLSAIQPLAKQMLGSKLITKQTGAAGRICNAVYIAERKWVRREFYFAILMDRASNGPMLVASTQGGMDIEAVAKDTPDAILKVPVNIKTGLDRATALELAKKLTFEGKSADQVCFFVNAGC